ncbi:hypothetical protein F5Y09DRAFT_336080 [Xylaria sp. FL1042]|nr:hypothetical protein F5Y09DRAFT_336080 [Xylaria sp. FL1042]
MPREINSVPTLTYVKSKKLIVLTDHTCKTGTHGLYLAFKKLGYKPYHMAEMVVAAGASAVKIMTDAMRAELFHEGTPCKHEFDKWFADYDIIIGVPFMLRSILKAYPDATFLLTERYPDKWAKSLNSVGMASTRLSHFSLLVLKHFDSFTSNMSIFAGRMLNYWTNGFGASEEGLQALIENYTAYIADILKLEDGFGWNELCPYMGIPIPDTPWPALNTPEEFHSLARPKFQTAISKGVAGMTTIVAVAAIGIWYGRKSLLFLLI